MWSPLKKISALASALAAIFALVWQVQQIRKDCPADLPLQECIKEIILSSTSKTEGKGKIENIEPDDEAWRVASDEDSPQAYLQYLNHPWTRHFGQAKKRLHELSEAEWKHEVKITDSEEVLERFINKYMEGPYVDLAKGRLKVAKAWVTIKKAIDPHVLFDFPSYYRDPVFEKLAKDALNKLDDQAWLFAVSAGTREAIAKYINVWSAVDGQHLQEAQTKLNELDAPQAWELSEKDPEAKCGEPSIMYSIAEGDNVRFFYEVPSKCMKDLPVHKDTLKFEGTKNGRRYQGKAYVFTKYCGGTSIGYDMSGSENEDHTLITLEGPAPVFDKDRCRVHHLTWDSTNSTLEFKARIPVEREIKAKAKTRDKPDQIRR